MNLFPQNKNVQFGFIAFATLASISLWSFRKIDDEVYKKLGALVMLVLVIVVLGNLYVFNKKNLFFKSNVILFLFLPFLGTFGAYLYHDQPFYLSFLLLRENFFWLFYFVLHIFEVPKKKVISLMIFVGLVWAILTIGQQITYPHALFYTRGDEESGTESRAGVYRFMLLGQQYGLFILLYFFYKYLISKNAKNIYNLLYVLLGLGGFYYFGTRQFALSALMCMGIAILYLKASLRYKYIALLLPIVLITWLFKDVLLGEYIELTNRQMQYGYDQDIRVLCANFYLNDYWPHWTAKILGNGQPHMLSDYGREMDIILAYFHFYRSDVGIIGTFNKFGILYVLNILWIIIKVIRIRIPDSNDLFLKLFFFNALFLLITNESFSNDKVIPFYCFILYLIDKSIEEHKEEKNHLQERME